MQIYGTSQLHGAQSINTPHSQRASETRSTAAPNQTDEVDLSPAAQLVGQVNDIPDIRQDRVAALKAAIANGTYETADKLNTAVDRLFDEIG
ncbi:MAG TPA: flagellar biosynthesis anti-sigma factor FlgM [Pirellulales bacterium]|nr:flagellar biosynthesis anti-sigma factor FlgM [Pirellulales bacterium]